MTRERWRQIEEIYQAVADLEVSERCHFLDQACASDLALRSAVEVLLGADGDVDRAIQIAIRSEAEKLAAETSELIVGKRIGPYRITAVIGVGGMGAIYRAARDDNQYQKEVAVKIVKRGMDLAAVVCRFRRERQILAGLEHRNIARLIDGGVTEDGKPYFVMEYIEGKRLTDYCADRTLKERLSLFRQVCDGVYYAHQNLIVHRDLKPANILVTKDGIPKLLDFGLAKVLNPDELPEQTNTLLRMLTPDYASPEQVRGGAVATASDIYSLGAILYELVSGRRAHQFKNRTTAEMERIVCEEDPPPLDGELGSIAQMAMQKDLRRRYESVEQLSEDVRLYLEGFPVLARKGAAAYRLRKFIRRNKVTLAASTIALLSIVGAVIGAVVLSSAGPSLWSAEQTIVPVQLTSYPGHERRPALSPQGTRVAFEWDGGQEGNFDIYVKLLGQSEPLRLTTDAAPDLSPAWSPDGKHIAFLRVSENGRAQLLTVAALGGPERKMLELTAPVRYLLEEPDWGGALAWAPDGHGFIVSLRDAESGPYRLVYLDPQVGQTRPLTSPPAGIMGDWEPSLSPEGKRLTFRRVYGATASEILLLPLTQALSPAAPAKQLTSLGVVSSAPTWAPDGRSVLFSSNMRGIEIIQRISDNGGPVRPAGISGTSPTTAPDSHRLIYQSAFSDVNIWRTPLSSASGAQSTPWASSSRTDQNAQFSPDGRRVAFESDRSGASEIYVADTNGGRLRQVTSGTSPLKGTPRWSPDGKYLAFDANVSANNWEVFVVGATGGAVRQITHHPAADGVAAWSGDGKWLYFVSLRTGRAEVWKVARRGGAPLQVTHNGGFSASESPDGTTLFYTRNDGVAPLFRMPLTGGKEELVIPAVHARAFCIKPQGVYYIQPELGNRSSIRFLPFGKSSSELILSLTKPPGFGLAVSPDSKWLLYSQLDQSGSDLMLIEHFR